MTARLVGVLAALLAAAGPAVAASLDEASPRGSLPFAVDVVSLPGTGLLTKTRVTVGVSASALEAAGGSGLRVAIILRDRGGEEIESGGGTFEIPQAGFLGAFSFLVPAGRAEGFVLVDALESDASGEMEFDFEVPDYEGETLMAAEPLVGRCDAEALGGVHADLAEEGVLPHPGRTFGETVPGPCVLLRAVDRETEVEEPEYRYRVRVRDERGGTLEELQGSMPRRNGAGAVVVQPDSTRLSAGRYTLEVEIRLGDRRAKSEGWFRIDATRLRAFSEPVMMRTLMDYVGTYRERQELARLGDAEVAAYWRGFWERRDPDPDAEGNPMLAELTKRVEHADRRFGGLEPGWRSDRGRIYILYGAPEQTERRTNDPSYPVPTEIWYYYARGLTFVFQDPEGFGDYRLTGSRR
jgi:GWxTD domain-containing protein